MFSRFSRKKVKVDALMVVEKAIAIELNSFKNHLQTVQMSYDNIIKLLGEIKKDAWQQHNEIVKLLKEIKENGKNR